jgi:probable phosphoglycerate mutase
MIRVYIDGGARGNPGPAGYGVRIEDADGTLIEELFGGLGIATNNVAEYNGLLAALKWAVDHGHQDVQVRADSELLVKQMRGEYKVKHPGLQPLAARARLLVGQLDDVTFQHVRREQNKEADRLSNLGMDEAEATLKTEKERGPANTGTQPQRSLF